MIPLETFFSVQRYAHKALWKEGEGPWSALLSLENYLKSSNPCQIEIKVPKGVHLVRPELISIGKGTVIDTGVTIHGPCIIGKNCIIRHGAFIREGVVMGDHCMVGHSAELKHAILLDYAYATHLVYVGDSILGNWANLGAGVKCANLRLDRTEIHLRIEGKKIPTGLKKMGALIGDRSQIGCNCVLNPGTLIGRESAVYPLINFGGYIPPRSQVRNRAAIEIEPFESTIWEQIR